MMDVETIFDSDREEYEFMQEKKEQPMKEQIEEMQKDIMENTAIYDSDVAQDVAETLVYKGYSKQEWISVEDRLPERNGRYLTHCRVCGGSLVCILYYNKYDGFYEGTVTHWMPLPEPPKMKGGAE